MPSEKLEWDIVDRQVVSDHRIFTVGRTTAVHPQRGNTREFTTLDGADWVNVIALTRDNDVVLIRQFRFGTEAVTLEIPGGVVERGEDPLAAGIRECREESGYAASRWEVLGAVEPNPAIQSNRCTTVIGYDAEKVGEPDLDDGEAISVELRPLTAIADAIRAGEITHSLVVTAFYFLLERAGGWARPADVPGGPPAQSE